MSFFKDILSKLGIGHDDNQPTSTTTSTVGAASTTTTGPATTAPAGTAPVNQDGLAPSITGTSVPRTDSTIDVGAKLDGMASGHAEKLNWRTSVVDLLKLLGIDSSLEHRKGLANELGCPADKLNDSAEMNMWLHKAILQKVAASGGTVPADLL
ncbi:MULTISPECIES: DUF3597 domain-containing protein [Pseudomonas]|uniref:DUF3597 domain-containing protein n=1 Tax=Pseudomonas TaxID=286 RepID=UPI00058E9FCD|nr:DUF3597 domain-containing protein [Pseudomonas massiliensis]